MTFKRTLPLLFFIVLSTATFAQDYKASVKQSFTTYYKHIIAGEWDKSMDYLPPAMFKIVPRAQLIATFESLMNNPDMQIKLTGFEIKDVYDIRKIDTAHYVKIKYVGGMTMKMKADSAETKDQKETRLNLTKAALANTFGSESVSLNVATEVFTIAPIKTSWAISKDGTKDWKFVNVEPKQRLIMEKLLPKEIIEESVN